MVMDSVSSIREEATEVVVVTVAVIEVVG